MISRTWVLTRIIVSAAIFALLALSCGGGTSTPTADSQTDPICNCTPTETPDQDYRHDAKHVPLPASTGASITVATMLGWPVGADPGSTAPRTGRELQMFSIPQAFAQSAGIVGVDCDIHVEISDTADKNAPRVIVETPIDSEYCDARRSLRDGLAAHGFTLSTTSGEINPPIPVSVVGMAFQDFEHNRGSAQVKTTWELHPAIVTVLP